MNIEQIIADSISVKQKILNDKALISQIEKTVEICIDTFRNNGKVLLCGNGGSAADAQHIAAELSGRFNLDREPLFAEALHVNSSFVTAVANDYGYDHVFSRMVKAAGRAGDVLIGISTSGNSANVLNAVREAKALGMKSVAFTGAKGGEIAGVCNVCIKVPSTNTARIQEAHIMIGHILCEAVENTLFARS
ncbi:MAG TPA: SIS domain-containing protein [Bacteroidetes bacterium]|nr:SIS domain-containing protein [Bacteroidota bacterium]